MGEGYTVPPLFNLFGPGKWIGAEPSALLCKDCGERWGQGKPSIPLISARAASHGKGPNPLWLPILLPRAAHRPGSAAPGGEPAASAAAGWHPAPGQDQQPRKVCKPRNQTVTQPAWERPKQARAASVGAPAWKVCCTRQERLTLHLGRRGKPSLCWT
ncbi:hypothetical protein KIL84_008223 [Mauremys mutica]|uniref:Uncharacterized protein n=1 Tax=Mauremys mutica TaxID=74926 RepID=A0A9D4AZB6_9SAUR|nr:hypothetical protein KIL84_008223 [Mauremys mutica]